MSTAEAKISRNQILGWLREENPERLKALFCTADRVRRQHLGNDVHLRGLIEFSNRCARSCCYCGLRRENIALARYCMTSEEITDTARLAAGFGYGTVVLQSGEDTTVSREWITGLIRQIINETGLAVTLSLGERCPDDLLAWKNAGADRYLLRFETSNRELYRQIHPPLPGCNNDRMAQLGTLRELGYEVGSGIMVGIPGQSHDDLANDIETFRLLDLDMIGIGPFLPHPATPLGCPTAEDRKVGTDQVPATELMTLKTLALTRIACPFANIPATTALATMNHEDGIERGLSSGANIIMPNLTPCNYRKQYEIYPSKACHREPPHQYHQQIQERISALGRTTGKGRGDSPNQERRRVSGQTGNYNKEHRCRQHPGA